jgi:biotin carboxylase
LSLEETEAAFNALIHTPKYGGGELDRVLVQEYLRGPEYAIDTVSGGGHTKILAVWRYQKMPMNDAAFVYQCSELVDAVGVDGHLLPVCEYCLKALDALDVAWGPCHTEVKDTVDGPTMIEVNPRWHAQDFCPITRLCLSTDSLVSTVDAFVFPGEICTCDSSTTSYTQLTRLQRNLRLYRCILPSESHTG